MSEPEPVLCLRCGYDLRATPAEGNCPECNTPVSESVAFAAIPVRPAWKDSDPRWRRRIVAGLWVIVLMPLLPLANELGLVEKIKTPALYGVEATQRLDESFLFDFFSNRDLLFFCVGFVLLFAKERGRRTTRLDWTRRWGVLGCYAVALMGVSMFATIWGLVLIGISALHLTLPIEAVPPQADAMAWMGDRLARYSPQLSDFGWVVLPTASTLVALLACGPLYDALRSSLPSRRPRLMAMSMLLPLALIAGGTVLWLLIQMAIHRADVDRYQMPPFYFLGSESTARLLLGNFDGAFQMRYPLRSGWVDGLKYLTFVVIATWLTIAQFRTWRRGGRDFVASET